MAKIRNDGNSPSDDIPPPKPGDPASVGGGDIDRAVKFWERFAPPGFGGLIVAKAEKPDKE